MVQVLGLGGGDLGLSLQPVVAYFLLLTTLVSVIAVHIVELVHIG